MKKMGVILPVIAVSLVFFLLMLSCEREQAKLVPDEYSAWESPTDVELNYPIPGHVEQYRRIFINPVGTKVVAEERQNRIHHVYPDGTIIIKDIYATLIPAPDEKPIKQTVMIKAPNHPKSRGGWLWIVKDMKTSAETVIANEFCFDCHANANEEHPYGDKNSKGEHRDYVYFPYLTE